MRMDWKLCAASGATRVAPDHKRPERDNNFFFSTENLTSRWVPWAPLEAGDTVTGSACS